ncbi:MAG: toxin [bacterium]|nr:toxin [bacterium]
MDGEASDRRTRRRRVIVLSEVDRRLLEEGVQTTRPGPAAPVRALPDRASGDTDIAWGDARDSNDRRLEEDVPPHWGRQ